MKKEWMSSRIRLATLPTPLEEVPMKFLDEKLEVWFKRDDLTEFIGSGNKIRKLEYLMEEAKRLETRKVVTCGGIQSNHCRATAFAARKLGMQPVLFLRGSEPEKAEGNLFLNRLLDAEIHWITAEQYAERDAIMTSYREQSPKANEVYLIPEGGSNITGSLGYVRAVSEMAEQTNLDFFDAIFCPVGSGGTYAGLLAGLKMNHLKTQLIGINVTLTDSRDFELKIKQICDGYFETNLLDEPVKSDAINIIDGYCGEAYAVPTKKGIGYIKDCVLHTGILLDPVYTSKAFDGMVEESKKRGFKRVLFIHTGGGFGNFAYSANFNG